MTDQKIIVALDYPEAAPALDLVARLEPALCRLKVGKELFTSAGPQLVEQLMQRGFQVFLDLKFHDIPNTTAQACKAAAALGVWMVNVHALGGRRMMEAARDAVAQATRPPKLIAVTVLTSMAQQDLAEIGVTATPAEMVLRLALLARDSGLDGVVCSAQEAPMLRQRLQNGHGNYAVPDDETRHARFPDGTTSHSTRLPKAGIQVAGYLPIPLPKGEGGRESLREFHVNEFCLVTPGIRPADSSADDQSRIMTPRAALENGSSYLVIGRPITKAADPLLALQNIYKEIEGLE